MDFKNILLSTLILIVVGIIESYIYIKLDNKDFFGGFKAGMIVGIIGGILGSFIFDLIFKLPIFQFLLDIPYIKYLLVNPFNINFIAVILGAWMFLWIYEYISEHTERS
ncbi:MAG: hypothetical protein ACRCWI_05775 [Brevinema sp.]